MRFTLEPKGLDFCDLAPMRIAESARLRASAEQVYGALVDAKTWPRWYPLMFSAEWVSGEPARVGGERDVAIHGLGRYRERFIALEPSRRFSFTIVQGSMPMANAIVEDFQLSETPNGSRLDWVMAVEPRALGKLGRPLLERVMRRIFRAAGERLDRLLAGG